MYTTEIFVAYIRERSAYKIVTPYKTVVRVLQCHPDDAVLEALRATRNRDVVLITKHGTYEMLGKGESPRDDVLEAIQRILYDKNVRHERIDEDSHKELVELMKADIEKENELMDLEGQKLRALEQAANGTLDKLPEYLKDMILEYAEAQRKASRLHSDLLTELDIFCVPFQSLAQMTPETGAAFVTDSDAVATDGLARLVNGGYSNVNKLLADIEKVFLHYANRKADE